MVRPRWIYFALFAFRATAGGRFFSVFYLDRGLRASAMGTLFAIDALVGTFSTTLLSAAVDRRLAEGQLHARERAMRLSFAVTSLAFCAQALVDLHSPVPPFALFLGCRLVMAVVFAPCVSICDAHTLAMLGADRARFGEERLYGAVSWALANMALGVLMDFIGSRVMYFGTLVLGATAVYILSRESSPKHGRLPEPATEEAASPTAADRPAGGAAQISSWHLLRAYMANAHSRAFFFAVFCIGVGMSLVESLLFLLLVEDLKSSRALCGLSVVVTVAFEIPLFQKSKRLLDTLGVRPLFALGMVCYIVRAFGYTLCSSGWCILAFEPLHGVTFACCHLSAIQYVAIITPKELMTTGQGVKNSIQGGLGFFTGTFVGGFVIQYFGEKVLYRGAACLVLIGLFVFLSKVPALDALVAVEPAAAPSTRIGKATSENDALAHHDEQAERALELAAEAPGNRVASKVAGPSAEPSAEHQQATIQEVAEYRGHVT